MKLPPYLRSMVSNPAFFTLMRLNGACCEQTPDINHRDVVERYRLMWSVRFFALHTWLRNLI